MLIGWNGETCFFLGSFLKPLFPQLLEYICEEQVKRTKGFVLQVQQGVTHEKSHMQVAEERQSGWLNVPRIGVFAHETPIETLGGSNEAKERMETALAKAEEQWRNGVEAELQMCSDRFEPVDGAKEVPTDSWGNVHGMAKCTYPDGKVYVGGYQHGLYHGQAKYTQASGAFVLGFWQMGLPSGEAVQFSKDRQKARLLKDGKLVHELSQSEAAKKVEELGLSKLLSWNVLDPIWKDFGRRKVTKRCQIVVKLSKKWAQIELYIILTAKSTGIGFENYSFLMFSLSCFYFQKRLQGFATFLWNTFPPTIMEVKNGSLQ